MKNAAAQVIYVGKAKVLKNRVRQYFQSSRNATEKQLRMVSEIADFEYIITDSETEALVLECNLIKKHRPPYNVMLKDGKSYPYIKISNDPKYPGVYVTRSFKKDGSKYFGPYVSGLAVKQTMEALRAVFPVRSCAGKVESKKRPCLYYHIKQCKAPCRGDVSEREYAELVTGFTNVLEGKYTEVTKQIKEHMLLASQQLEYEKAAVYRDRLAAIEKITENQKITKDSDNDQDVIGVAMLQNDALVQLLFIRDGKMVGGEHVTLEHSRGANVDELIVAFIKQYYSDAAFIPAELLTQAEIEETEVVESWLTALRGKRVHIVTPKRGDKRRLIEMAIKNAEEAADARLLKQQREVERTTGAVEELANALGLKSVPLRIEGFDISNIQGVESVASMVVFENGKPAKNQYRRFKIKTVEGANDFASMHEVITRRFTRGLAEERQLKAEGKSPETGKFSHLPDLILIDGGKGQLHFARDAMRELGVDAIPTFGLAKEYEEIYMEHLDKPIFLDRSSNALHLIQRLRDEAHRFAITYHRSLRGKHSLRSVLEQIPEIGPKRRMALLKAFGAVSEIKKAEPEALKAVEGMNESAAKRVLEYFQQ